MFTYLGLKNFRAFQSVGVRLAPITVFVGPNNAGKSSILSGIRILAQTVQSEDYRIPLLLNGPMGDFGTYKDLVFQNESRRRIGITLGTEVRMRDKLKEAKLELNFAYRSQRREVILQESSLYDDTGQRIVRTAYSPSAEKHSIEIGSQPRAGKVFKALSRRVTAIHFFLPYWVADRDPSEAVPRNVRNEVKRLAGFGEATLQAYMNGLGSVEYLGPFRVAPQRTVLFSGERPTRIGMAGERAAHVLASDYLRRGRKKKQLVSKIISWLKAAEIASDLKIQVLSDRHFEILVQHPVTREYENLADVGYGSSQVLPVIAGGLNLLPGTTFIVEQPEIHLHPRAQSELGDFVSTLYQNRVQTILETHSEHLIVRLQQHVARGRVKNADIVVYYLHAPSDKKEAVRLNLLENGMFAEKWPRGFFDDRLKEATALARASQRG